MQALAYLHMVNVPMDDWNSAIVRIEQIIGRGRDVSIVVPNRFRAVSRRHAAIWADSKGQVFLRDLGSRCGTHVNGIHLKPQEQYRLELGDRINLAGLELQITASAPPLMQLVAELNVPRLHDTCDLEEMDRRVGDEARELLGCLSNAELEVMLWLCRGYTSLDAVGGKLHRSPHTVRTQLNSIFRKLAVHSRDELIGKVYRANREVSSAVNPSIA